MSARNRFFILLGIIFAIAATYYFFSTDHSRDLVLIGTVDANQVIVSAQVEGRIQKLLVDEGTPVKAGDLIAVLDPSELAAQEAASTATIDSLQHKVAEMRDTERSTTGSTSSDVENAQAKLSSAKAQLMQAKAALDRTQATVAAPSNWPKQASRQIRSASRPRPIYRPPRRRLRRSRSWSKRPRRICVPQWPGPIKRMRQRAQWPRHRLI
jgi:multidrug resistance efflux pump